MGMTLLCKKNKIVVKGKSIEAIYMPENDAIQRKHVVRTYGNSVAHVNSCIIRLFYIVTIIITSIFIDEAMLGLFCPLEPYAHFFASQLWTA
jgi:hypothetical protein